MSRKGGEGGRRPLLSTFEGNNREMLRQIRDNLQHVHKEEYDPQPGKLESLKDLSKSSPNLLGDKSNQKVGAPHVNKTDRLDYTRSALEKIRQNIQGFKIDGGHNGYVHVDVDTLPVNDNLLKTLVQIGYKEDIARRALALTENKSLQAAMDEIHRISAPDSTASGKNGFKKLEMHNFGSKVIRKPSFEEKYSTGSPVNSENSSVRSDSPNPIQFSQRLQQPPPPYQTQSPQQRDRSSPAPPPLPPRVPTSNVQQEPPAPPRPPQTYKSNQLAAASMSISGFAAVQSTPPGHIQHMMNRMSIPQNFKMSGGMANLHTGPVIPPRNPHPVVLQNAMSMSQIPQMQVAPQAQQQIPVSGPAQMINSQMQGPPAPGYNINTNSSNNMMHMLEANPQRFSHSSSPLSSHSSSPIPVASMSRLPLQPVPAFNAKPAPILTLQAKSHAVPRPMRQTTQTPPSLPIPCDNGLNGPIPEDHYQYTGIPHEFHDLQNIQPQLATAPPLPHRSMTNLHMPGPSSLHLQQQQQNYVPASSQYIFSNSRPGSPVNRAWNQSPMSGISTNSTPSSTSDINEKLPPPYPGHRIRNIPQAFPPSMAQQHAPMYMPEELAALSDTTSNGPSDITNDQVLDDQSSMTSDVTDSTNISNTTDEGTEVKKITSPKPERKNSSRQKDKERQETRVTHFSPQAFKFYMEQHVENILKQKHERMRRQTQLENEMTKVGISEDARHELRKMLYQKESSYLRLRRAKLDKEMFQKIKTLGIGAFGEVALVKKRDNDSLYAMKTLRKRDVLRRNQVAHVKAERDILSEADNEWVVKLYYSFQDRDNLYFVMDYIPGGDMMSLLIKFGIFNENLARFYIAELVLAIESVHKMNFIHRDIKPDNILIDKDGHIKLTDFGLCTGFRWTHNSKYYQKEGHAQQDSMDMWTDCDNEKELLKPLERRKRRNQRDLAHSLVGTPNYIAPEVLQRLGYTSSCDWWSVGVILYEMLVGQPPFLSNTPQETQYKVITWKESLKIPKEAKQTQEAENLIYRLCSGPRERLGVNGGASEIKAHPFFKTIEFNGLRRTQAPYVPQIRHPTDTSNFDEVECDRNLSGSTESLKKVGHAEGSNHPDFAFFEFTFRSFFDDRGHPRAQRMPDIDGNPPVYV